MAMIRSEFAAVDVEAEDTANGTRLKVEDLQSGRIVYFDALELETLAWLPYKEFEVFLDPSAYRWNDLEDDLDGMNLHESFGEERRTR